MTAPGTEVAVARLGSDLKLPDALLSANVATTSSVDLQITGRLTNYDPGTGTDTATVQTMIDSSLNLALSNTSFEIRWSGPSWPDRPKSDRPARWVGGPSRPALGGSTAGGPGMAPIDEWVG